MAKIVRMQVHAEKTVQVTHYLEFDIESLPVHFDHSYEATMDEMIEWYEQNQQFVYDSVIDENSVDEKPYAMQFEFVDEESE